VYEEEIRILEEIKLIIDIASVKSSDESSENAKER